MKPIKHYHNQLSTFNPARFLHAKPPEKTAQNNLPQLLTNEDKKNCSYLESLSKAEKPLLYASDAQKIAALRRRAALDEKPFEAATELLKNPTRMGADDSKNFIKALANGRFTNRGKNALIFLSALRGGEEEKAQAQKILKKLADGETGEISELGEYRNIKSLNEAREKDLSKATLKDTAARASMVLETSDFGKKIHKVTGKYQEKTSENLLQQGNWEMETLDPEIRDQLNYFEHQEVTRMAQMNEKTREQEILEGQLEASKQQKPLDKTRIAALETALKKLIHEREILEAQITKIQLDKSTLEKREEDYLSRMGSRYEALQSLIPEIGFDLTRTKRLKLYLPEEVTTDRKTGHMIHKEAYIEIKKLQFIDEKTDSEPTSPNQLTITYQDVDGTEKQCSYKYFIAMINAFEGHPDIQTLEEMNKTIPLETGFADLEEGMQLSAAIPKILNAGGKTMGEISTIQILAIDKQHRTITLDRAVTSTPRQWINYPLHSSQYHDRINQKFSFGEFSKLVKQHGYKRHIPIEEAEKVCAAVKAKGRFTPPKQENNPELVIWRDDNGQIRWGQLTLENDPASEKGEKSYFFKEVPVPQSANDYIKLATEEGIPLDLVAGRRAKTGLNPNALGKTRFNKKFNFGDARTLMNLRDQGNIVSVASKYLNALSSDDSRQDQQPSPPSSPKLKLVKNNDPGQIAAQSMSNKYNLRNPDPRSPYNTENDPDATPESIMNNPTDGNGYQSTRDTGMQEQSVQEQEKEEEKSPEAATKPSRKDKYEEALPYDKVHKVGGHVGKTQGFIMGVWSSTRFLSAGDLWAMGKTMWEYYTRRFERRQKDRYSDVGKHLPFFSPEMRRINQSAENEQANQFKESFDQKGVLEIWERLKLTNTRDEMKACFITLASKGMILWDDIDMWKNLNKFLGPDKAIPIPANGDPKTRMSEDDNRTGASFLQAAIDSLWGEGQYNDWYSSSKGAYQTNARKYFEEGKELEGVDGGHALKLANLLKLHREGVFVDPQEFEGLILHAIDAGKSSMQAKLYYMIEGVTAVAGDGSGRTIMPFDRIAHINSEMLVKFPILEYITASVPRGNGKSYRFTLDDYKGWAAIFDGDDPMNCKPNKNVDQFLWDFVIPSDETQNRINKVMRNAENLDHDDMWAYLPPATEQVITDACGATTGSKKFLTIEGYANAFPGFSQYFKALSSTSNKNKLREAVKSYVRFEGIMLDRYEKGDKTYQRFDHSTLTSATIVSTTPPQAYIKQMNDIIKSVVYAYGDQDLIDTFELTQQETGNIHLDRTQMDLQKRVNFAFKNFGKKFDKVTKTDNGEKMLQIIASSPLEGMPFGLSDAEKDLRKSQKASFNDNLTLA